MHRPPLYLDDLVSIWTAQEDGEPWSDRLLERYHQLKVEYLMLQILTQIQSLLKLGYQSNCLTMRCFHIMKTTLEVKMTNFAFCDSLKASQARGSVSGCPTDQ